MTVGEYIRNNHVCPYCGSSDYHVFNVGVIDIYKCMVCHRKMWEYEVLLEKEDLEIKQALSKGHKETITDDDCCDNRLIVTKKKYDNLLEKHLSECRQISKYDIEIKKLKNENAKLKQIIDGRNKNMVINEQ